MRCARIKLERAATYHCMSRVIQRQMLFRDVEKERFRVLMRQLEDFCGVRILTYAILDNHFHILLKVPERKEISDVELIRRAGRIYSKTMVQDLAKKLADLRATGQERQADELKSRFTYRMYDVSEFMKALKQRFTQWYNRTNARKGTLWEERFKSLLLEHRLNALRTVAAYIDLNAVRAGLVEDPKDYRFCGYAEAVAGEASARRGLGEVTREVVRPAEWCRVARAYRQTLFERGSSGKGAISPAKVREVIEKQGELSIGEALHCRVRYFSDGIVLGSHEFVESIYQSHRRDFGRKRKPGARPMRYGAWDGLCIIRDLRQTIIALPE